MGESSAPDAMQPRKMTAGANTKNVQREFFKLILSCLRWIEG